MPISKVRRKDFKTSVSVILQDYIGFVSVLRRFLKRIKGCRASLDEPDLECPWLSGRLLDGILKILGFPDAP
ncbi:unnamed protein product [Rhizophagus irregularis]|nr:unnamed protein product [Rhizophagus irregularis]